MQWFKKADTDMIAEKVKKGKDILDGLVGNVYTVSSNVMVGDKRIELKQPMQMELIGYKLDWDEDYGRVYYDANLYFKPQEPIDGKEYDKVAVEEFVLSKVRPMGELSIIRRMFHME